MTPRNVEADRIAAQALVVLEEHMADIDKYAPAFARQYAAAVLARRKGGTRSAFLHPDVAHLLRGLVDDELVADRGRRAA